MRPGRPYGASHGSSAPGISRFETEKPVSPALGFPPVPVARYTNLHTASFDKAGRLWFTGQSGWYGRVDPAIAKVDT